VTTLPDKVYIRTILFQNVADSKVFTDIGTFCINIISTDGNCDSTKPSSCK
jgi:hypothetical protein